MDLKQKQLECPFTWALDKQWAREFDEMDEPVITFDEEPLLAFINSIMLTYFRAEKEDYIGASNNLKATDDIWQKLKESQLDNIGVSTKVLQHIKSANEFFIYNLTKCKAKADCLLECLENSQSFQSIFEVATIDGCKSAAWFSFHEKGHQQSLNFARFAAMHAPNCSLWYYILGKSLKYFRRAVYSQLTPSDEEENAIIRSCELSDTPFYKILLVQMYRDKKDFSRSDEICLQLFTANAKPFGVLLKLSIVFTYNFNHFDPAKKCLDKAGELQKSGFYYYHLGFFYSKKKEHATAAKYYLIAANKGIYKADMQYITVMQIVNPNFKSIEYLQIILAKYSNNVMYKQLTLVHIAMHYYFKRMDDTKAFLQAIEINPKHYLLKNFSNLTIKREIYNIYNFVSKILQNNHRRCSKSSGSEYMLRQLEDYCKQYRETQ